MSNLSVLCYRGTPFKNNMPSRGWWERFSKRHPVFNISAPSVDADPKTETQSDKLKRYFEDAKCFLSALNILNHPERIYNMADTWYFDKAGKLEKSVPTASGKLPNELYSQRHNHASVTMCVSAAGRWLPVMITYQGSLPETKIEPGVAPKQTLYTHSESGHIDADLYTRYIRHIEPFCVKSGR